MVHTRFCLLSLLVLSVGWLSGCSGPVDEVNSQISDALTNDNQLDATEAQAIRSLLIKERKDLKDEDKTAKLYKADGSIDDDALSTYIKRTIDYRKLAKDGKTPTVSLVGAVTSSKPLRLKVYLEASASMFPYDAPSGNGAFKRTLNDVLTEFDAVNPGQGKLFVVNTEVNDLGLSLPQFFKEKNIFTVAKTKGKTTSTDFEGIFSEILRNTSGDDLSVLVSDLIYSDPSLTGMSAQKTLDAASSLLTTVFNPYSSTHSMLVVKLKSDFDGTYYSWNNAKKKYTGERPYYLCLIGRNETLQRLYQDQTYQTIRQFDQLPGFTDSWFFGRDTKAVTPFYSLLVTDPARKGHFKRSNEEVRSHAKAIHALDDVQPDVTDKSLAIPVAVDLSALRLPASLLTDASQYVVEGKDNFKVSAVQTYEGANGTTHKLLLTTNKPARGERTATIRLRRQFPPHWVANTNTTNDASPDANSTFGIQNLLQGVERAYNPNNQTEYFTLTITLN
ncbi:tellurite resistance TerB family protein [Spirosoma flavum]|uniref:Lipoprotein n=1 Tax=Spirosoma flavum TaxID=2048557 RepID=A0ABW6AH63_9BACT